MTKAQEVFLEFKFGSFDTMHLRQLSRVATGLTVPLSRFTPAHRQAIERCNLPISLTFDVVPRGRCPADPQVRSQFEHNLQAAIRYQPARILLDRFRFGGRCSGQLFGTRHRPCKWCRGLDRAAVMVDLAQRAREMIPRPIELGYYAIAFSPTGLPELIHGLGQHDEKLAQYVDLISPMLYVYMMGKSTGYIQPYLQWLHTATEAPLLPILQVKDMPDRRRDRITPAMLVEQRQAALSGPVLGVSWFSLDGAVEKDKFNGLMTALGA